MHLRRVIVALALAAGAAFAPPTRRQAMQPRRAADEVCGECDPMSPFSDGCRPCADGRSVFVGDTKVTSKTLRDIDVVSANGNRVRLDDLMGRKASVVVFLRHLGWPYCWDYANAWSSPAYLRSLDRAGVAGPVFISVAPRETAAEKMNKFLDINPMVPRERLFVDDSPTFAAYASAGFKNIGEDQKTSLADATKLTAPRLSAGAWWRYLTNVASLSPVPDGLKFGEVPEGVLRLGGTFVVDDDTVRFAHADKFPGDHPAIADVLRAAGISLVDSEGVAV